MAKRLVRLKKGRIIGGVCSGLGDYFDIDPVLFRLIFVLVVFAGGTGILAYIILWIVLPDENNSSYAEDISKTAQEKDEKKKGENKKELGEKAQKEVQDLADKYKEVDGKMIIGGVLVLLGLIFMFNNLIPSWNFLKLWPLAVVILGLALVINSMGKE